LDLHYCSSWQEVCAGLAAQSLGAQAEDDKIYFFKVLRVSVFQSKATG
jgi:hypothetical protein